MANVRVTPRSLTDAYKRREGDFAPNLVGLQFTDGVSLFTFGNFQVTTNLDSRLNVNFTLGGQWSDYYSLENLNLTSNQSNTLQSNELFINLNFDPFNISRYVYFGSFYEFIRVTIEETIQSWKGSVYLNPTKNSNFPINTVLSFNYNSGNDTAQFLIPKNEVINNFQLILDDNQDFNQPSNEIYNITRDYKKYVIWDVSTNKETPVIGYTGSTTTNPYINIQTKGNPFPYLTGSTFGQITYHLKPNATEVQLFFEELSDFQNVILNRLTSPIYKSSFEVPKESDGVFYYTTESFIWPVSDGYNLDINTTQYANYVQSFLDTANNFDRYKTDLVSRRFVSESIHEFDTNGGTDTNAGDEKYGMKVSKLLRIYGREYDEVKKYIDGISFANVVTYDKLDNTSDELIKIMAKNLGFDVLLTVTTDDFNLLEQIKPSFETPFSGYSRALSAKELDIELWRRLVINAWWLFKSKGTRKVIEFFFSLFKIPECMVTLNEYVYLAENRLNTEEVYQKLNEIYGGPNLFNISNLPLDDYGFPRVLPETDTNYFQMNGFWYNGGTDITTGNNPHIGPYDFGQSYFNQFECFVPNFKDYLTASTLVTVSKNYFNNYNEGTFIFDQNGLPVPYYGSGYANTLNNGMVENVIVNSAGLTYVGGSNSPSYGRPSGDTYSMKVSFTAGNKTICDPCAQHQLTYDLDGIVYVVGNPNKPLTDQLCCKNYWLPITVNAPTCPNITQLVITVDGVILDTTTNQSVPQNCCSKTTLGFNVVWDGMNCTTPKAGGNTSGTISIGTNTATSTLRTVSSVELFQNSTITPNTGIQSGVEPRQNYTCYWCPPNSYVQTICSVDAYLTTLTNQQIIQLAINLGSPVNVDVQGATNLISNIYTPFFETYGCLMLDIQDNVIKDKACCELRGGVLTNVNGTNYCIKPNPNPCVGSQVNPNTHVWVTPTNTLLPQSCCNQNGQYWISPLINGDNVILMTANGSSTFLDIPGSTFAGQTSYCSACPSNLIEVIDGTSIFITDSNNNMLTQQCCVDYGFNWDYSSKAGGCTKCPTVVNYGTPLDSTVITDLSGNDLTQQCCTVFNGYYVNVDGKNTKCYICPPTNIYNSSTGVMDANPDYQIISNEITYLGNSLTQQCCNQYNTQFGQFTWSSTQKKCLNNSIGGGSISTFTTKI